MKFDGVSGNKDKELGDPKGYGAIEYAYYKMAVDAGITMSPCRIFEENGRRHFMTRRFDRLEGGEKLHMQSLCGLAHYDFNQAGAYGYEQALQVIRRLGLPMSAVEEQFRKIFYEMRGLRSEARGQRAADMIKFMRYWHCQPKDLRLSRKEMTGFV